MSKPRQFIDFMDLLRSVSVMTDEQILRLTAHLKLELVLRKQKARGSENDE